MKVVKPVKVPVLARTTLLAGRPTWHLAAMLGAPLSAPRAIADEMTFWATTGAALGETGILDEGHCKARAEFLVAGHFWAPRGQPTGASFVRARCGSVDKRLAVFGDRSWRGAMPSEPVPMTQLPIDWAHAFGGARYQRNPYGRGAELITVDGQRSQPLPNVEHFGNIIRHPSDRPAPAGFMPFDVSFAQRRERAGTYDKQWFDEHFPGMPRDASPDFFNVASEDQWLAGFWRGDEPYLVENMKPDAPLVEGHLPGLVTRGFVTQQAPEGERFAEVPMRCDTVWLFPTHDFFVVIFHGSLPVYSDDAADIAHLVVGCEEIDSPKPEEHYRHALERRLDKDEGALAGISDSDLMPPRASGVVANVAEFDVGRWTKSENLAAAKQRRGAERQREQARAQLEADGLDPKNYALDGPMPDGPAFPPDDPDALVAYLREQQSRATQQADEDETEQARAREMARQQFAEMGRDYDAEVEKAQRQAAGPPKATARAQIESMLTEVRRSREEGVALDGLEQQLSDPSFIALLLQQERAIQETYRTTAHLAPSPAPMDADAAQQARVVAQAALDSGESLAERDFTGVDWSGMKLAGIDLRGALLEASNLAGCDLSGANLERAVLAKANLRGANLRGARLAGANLGASQLRDAALDGADLTEVILSRAELGGAVFKDVKLEGADLLFTKFERADLSGAAMPGANILNADLAGCRFVGANLSDATLVECTLDGADFSQAMLDKTTFVTCKGEGVSFRAASFKQGILVHGTKLPRADLRDAEMPQANLRGTVLTAARLDRANLTGGDLSECDCTDASLERVVLTGGMAIRTRLVRASLRGANLMDVLMSKAEIQSADLTGANLARADLSRVLGDGATKFTEAEVAHVRFLPKANPAPQRGVS